MTKFFSMLLTFTMLFLVDGCVGSLDGSDGDDQPLDLSSGYQQDEPLDLSGYNYPPDPTTPMTAPGVSQSGVVASDAGLQSTGQGMKRRRNAEAQSSEESHAARQQIEEPGPSSASKFDAASHASVYHAAAPADAARLPHVSVADALTVNAANAATAANVVAEPMPETGEPMPEAADAGAGNVAADPMPEAVEPLAEAADAGAANVAADPMPEAAEPLPEAFVDPLAVAGPLTKKVFQLMLEMVLCPHQHGITWEHNADPSLRYLFYFEQIESVLVTWRRLSSSHLDRKKLMSTLFSLLERNIPPLIKPHLGPNRWAFNEASPVFDEAYKREIEREDECRICLRRHTRRKPEIQQ